MRRFIGHNHLTSRLPMAGSHAVNFLTLHNISRFSATEDERTKARFSNHRLNDFMFSMMVLSASAIMITDRKKINYDEMSIDELVFEINKIPGFEKFSAKDIFTYGPDGWSDDDNRCYDRNSYAAKMREILEGSEAYRAFSEKYNEQINRMSGNEDISEEVILRGVQRMLAFEDSARAEREKMSRIPDFGKTCRESFSKMSVEELTKALEPYQGNDESFKKFVELNNFDYKKARYDQVSFYRDMCKERAAKYNPAEEQGYSGEYDGEWEYGGQGSSHTIKP